MILVLNGPNLNLLGKREPEVYGYATLADLETQCKQWGEAVGTKVVCRQSNFEGVLLEWLHGAAEEGVTGLVLNLGRVHAYFGGATRRGFRGSPPRR